MHQIGPLQVCIEAMRKCSSDLQLCNQCSLWKCRTSHAALELESKVANLDRSAQWLLTGILFAAVSCKSIYGALQGVEVLNA